MRISADEGDSEILRGVFPRMKREVKVWAGNWVGVAFVFNGPAPWRGSGFVAVLFWACRACLGLCWAWFADLESAEN